MFFILLTMCERDINVWTSLSKYQSIESLNMNQSKWFIQSNKMRWFVWIFRQIFKISTINRVTSVRVIFSKSPASSANGVNTNAHYFPRWDDLRCFIFLFNDMVHMHNRGILFDMWPLQIKGTDADSFLSFARDHTHTHRHTIGFR